MISKRQEALQVYAVQHLFDIHNEQRIRVDRISVIKTEKVMRIIDITFKYQSEDGVEYHKT